jgi:hypothetical protein
MYLPWGASLLTIAAMAALAGTLLPVARSGKPAESCLPTISFDSPRVGEPVTKNTDIYGRGKTCDDNYLWIVTRSANGEYASRTRDPIAVNGDGNWIDPMPATLSHSPPLKITYCAMITDAQTATEWIHRFKTVPLDGTLDLTGLSRPDRCLAEVTVRTR